VSEENPVSDETFEVSTIRLRASTSRLRVSTLPLGVSTLRHTVLTQAPYEVPFTAYRAEAGHDRWGKASLRAKEGEQGEGFSRGRGQSGFLRATG
jgi:hypothetical protein